MSFSVSDVMTFTTTECLIFIAILLFSWSIWSYMRRPPDLPPGPRGLPLLGYLPFMQEKSHVHFNELGKKYGDIFSIYLGRRLFIVLHSYDAIKEAFIKQSDIFAGRVAMEFLRKDEIPNIFASEGEVWRDYKRFTLSTLREFGLGKISLEPRIKEEIHYLLNTIESYNSKPTDIGDLLRMSISNVICSIKFGRRFDYNNENFQYLIRVLNEFLCRSEQVGLNVTVPKLLEIPGFQKLLGHKPARDLRDLLLEDIRKKIEERAKNHEAGSEEDFVSAWLTEADKRGPVNGKNFTRKRQCLGESLAKMELFEYFTSLLQKFTFKTPEGDKISFDYKMGTVAMPKPFRLIATPRYATKNQ